MKVVFVDWIYPEATLAARAAAPDLASRPWREQRDALLAQRFGCWDAWSDGCRLNGVAAEEVLCGATGLPDPPIAEWADGALVVLRHLGWGGTWLDEVKRRARAVVGMVSAAAPPDDVLRRLDLVVTAFPHYARRFHRAGLPTRYLPLAFDPRRLDRLRQPLGVGATDWPLRDLPVTFCGGLGIDRHWQAGRNAVRAVAESVAGFQWWGYRGPDDVGEALRKTHQGPAFGDAYFSVLARTRCALNRHGEVHASDDPWPLMGWARSWWTCNMRAFEATGMGALCFTENGPNLWEGCPDLDWPSPLFRAWDECVPFDNPADLVRQVRHYLEFPDRAAELARAGQARCLGEHQYEHRAAKLLEWCADFLR